MTEIDKDQKDRTELTEKPERPHLLKHMVLGFDVDLNGPGSITRFSRNHKLVISGISGHFHGL